jgi:hypothetical protein
MSSVISIEDSLAVDQQVLLPPRRLENINGSMLTKTTDGASDFMEKPENRQQRAHWKDS